MNSAPLNYYASQIEMLAPKHPIWKVTGFSPLLRVDQIADQIRRLQIDPSMLRGVCEENGGRR